MLVIDGRKQRCYQARLYMHCTGLLSERYGFHTVVIFKVVVTMMEHFDSNSQFCTDAELCDFHTTYRAK